MSAITNKVLLRVTQYISFIFLYTSVVSAGFELGSSISLSKAIEEHILAYSSLDPLRDKINYHKSTLYLSDRTETTHSWFSFSEEAWDAFQTYRKKSAGLRELSMCNACGNGFLIGMIAAIIQKQSKLKLSNEKVYYGILGSVVATIVMQNHLYGRVPDWREDLKERNDAFTLLSEHTLYRLICSVVCAGLSYLGNTYMIEKINALRAQHCVHYEPLHELEK